MFKRFYFLLYMLLSFQIAWGESKASCKTSLIKHFIYSHIPLTPAFSETVLAPYKIPKEVASILVKGLKEGKSNSVIFQELTKNFTGNYKVLLSSLYFFILHQQLVISGNGFDEKTKDFLTKTKNGTFVYVNAAPFGSVYYYEQRAYFEKKYGDNPNAHYIDGVDMDTLIASLKDMHKPIDSLEISTHGSPGVFILSSFAGNQKVNTNLLDSLSIPKGLFSANAEIRINSCQTGNGDIGDEFLNKLGKSFLIDGGTLYASQVNIQMDFSLNSLTKGSFESKDNTISTVLSKLSYLNPLSTEAYLLFPSVISKLELGNKMSFFPPSKIKILKIPPSK